MSYDSWENGSLELPAQESPIVGGATLNVGFGGVCGAENSAGLQRLLLPCTMSCTQWFHTTRKFPLVLQIIPNQALSVCARPTSGCILANLTA